MKMTSIYPEFKDIESGEETRPSDFVIVNVNETFCDKFIFIYKFIIAIMMFLLLIGFIVMVIITYA
jgi:hypothetical protein